MSREAGMMAGRRLRQLRLARNLSMEALAAEMGGLVTKQSLSKYENDKAQPSTTVLTKLASALGVKASYLFREPAISVEFLARRKSSVLSNRKYQKIRGTVEQALEDRVRLQELTGQVDGSLIPVREFRINGLDDANFAAETIRERWQLGLEPISNVCSTLESHRVSVLEVDTDEKFDGISAIAYDDERQATAAALVIRRDTGGECQRFNLACELGRLILDISEQVDEDQAAFRFGLAFLAPGERILVEVGSKRNFIQPEELLLLKKHFGIEMKALIRRFHDLEIITASYHDQWRALFGQYGWTQQEPGRLPLEERHWLRRTVLRVLSEGMISLDDAERMLGDKIEVEQPISTAQRRGFLKLPLASRRKILTEQAKRMAQHYEEDTEWRELDAGDVVDC